MNYDNQEQVAEWFEKYGDWDYEPKLDFKTLDDSKKFHTVKQVSAIMFLGSKLNEEHKDESYFLHGEHDVLYIGTFDMFEDFTEEDVKTAVAHGIHISDDGDGFQMYASM